MNHVNPFLSNEFFSLILNSVSEAIWSVDLHSRLTFVNKAAVKMFGFTRQEEMLGQHSHDLVHYKRPDGSIYPPQECPIQQAFSKGAPCDLEDELLWRANGSSFYARCRSTPIFDGGKIVGAAMIFSDVTEQHRVQELLVTKQAQFDESVKIANLGYWTMDVSSRLCHVSEQLATDWHLDLSQFPRSIDDLMREMIHPDDIEWVSTELEASLVRGYGFARDYRIVLPSGDLRWMESRARGHFKDGKLHLMTGISLDTTDRKNADAELAAAKEALAAVIAHDLRNPIQAIALQAELYLDEAEEEVLVETKALELILRNARQLNRLAEDILDIARIQTKQLDFRRTRCDLQQLLNALISDIRPTLGDHAVRVHAEGSDFFADVDEDRIRQILTNLLINAAKYSPDSTPIDVHIKKSAHSVRIAIRDYGSGIAEDLIPKIFDRYYRATPTKDKVDGLGLGLYVTKSLVELHGGKISVKSALGKGSTFYVEIPCRLVDADDFGFGGEMFGQKKFSESPRQSIH